MSSAVTNAEGSDGSMGILLLFMSGALQLLWQTVASAAMAFLYLAAARLLKVTALSGQPGQVTGVDFIKEK